MGGTVWEGLCGKVDVGGWAGMHGREGGFNLTMCNESCARKAILWIICDEAFRYLNHEMIIDLGSTMIAANIPATSPVAWEIKSQAICVTDWSTICLRSSRVGPSIVMQRPC